MINSFVKYLLYRNDFYWKLIPNFLWADTGRTSLIWTIPCLSPNAKHFQWNIEIIAVFSPKIEMFPGWPIWKEKQKNLKKDNCFCAWINFSVQTCTSSSTKALHLGFIAFLCWNILFCINHIFGGKVPKFLLFLLPTQINEPF